MTATEQVILVDLNDNPIGEAEKLHAHQLGLCHRAFSIFIYQGDRVLLQQRALNKYHSPGLWTNTCCSHPYPNESILQAGQRRLKEEMGLVTQLKEVGVFHYIAHFENGLIENEIDHVLVGLFNDEVITPNPDEIADYRWIKHEDLLAELELSPQQFTPWVKEAFLLAKKHMS